METVRVALQRLETNHPPISTEESDGRVICRCSWKWLPHVGAWMHVHWEAEFFQKFNPSIDFLELFALLATVVTWVPCLTNCTVLFHSDNTLTVHAVIINHLIADK